MTRPLPAARPYRATDAAPSNCDGLQRLLQEMQGLGDLLPGVAADPGHDQRAGGARHNP